MPEILGPDGRPLRQPRTSIPELSGARAACAQRLPPGRRLTPTERMQYEAIVESFRETLGARLQQRELRHVVEKIEKSLLAGRHLTEGVEDFAGADFGVTWGDAWTALGAQQKRDLSETRQRLAQQLSYSLAIKNPLARRILLDVVYHIGSGRQWSFRAVDPRVQGVLEKFWSHPMNDFRKTLTRRVWQYLVLGEQAWPVGINEQSGIMQLGYIDPVNIATVRALDGNPEVLDEIEFRARDARGAASRERRNIVRALPDGSWRVDPGDVFFFAHSRASNSTRGLPYIISLFDYLDLYDQALFTVAERQALLNSFVWDVKLEGMDEQQIQDWLARQPDRPAPGTMRAHNEKVEWSVVAPRLEAAEQDRTLRMILQSIVAGAGIAEHWLGRAEDVNRATARSLTFPVRFRLRALQEEIVGIIETLFDAQIYLCREKGALDGVEDCRYRIYPPEVGAEDIGEIAEAMLRAAQALTVAQDRGYITRRAARKLFGKLMEAAGVHAPQAPPEEENEDSSELAESEDITDDYAALADVWERVAREFGSDDGGGRERDAGSGRL